jgi:cytochrome P450
MSVDALTPAPAETQPPLFTPATVVPPPGPLSGLAALSAVRRNLLEVIDADLFTRPFRERRSFGRDYLAVCSPALMQAVLLDHADAFARAESQQRVLRPAVGEGLFTAEGRTWRRQRRAAAPAFRHELLRRMIPAFAEAGGAAAERLAALAAQGPVDVEPEMRRVTLAVVSRTLLAGFDQGSDPQHLTRTLGAFAEVVSKPVLLDVLGAPAWIPTPGRLRLRRHAEAMRGQARQALERRRSSGKDEGDLLGALIAARDPEPAPGSPTMNWSPTS